MTSLFDDFPAQAPPVARPRALTVTQAVMTAKQCIMDGLAPLWIEGEISGFKVSGNGHAYFNLKDEGSVLPMVLWRTSLTRLRTKLEDGKKVRIFGRFDLWPAQARFQFYAERVEPLGLGDMLARLEQLKALLSAEGLFSSERKRPLPRWPRVIGVVTSRSGAAIHDICKVVSQRCPSRIVLSPAIVQGKDAPADLLRALQRLARFPELDVIILGRGGGSIEDLWAFNDEALVRAIAAFPVPVISAVGHEIDVTLCDLVADVRAATPSQAAELAVVDRRALLRNLDDLHYRLDTAMQRQVLHAQAELARGKNRLGRVTRRWISTQQGEVARHSRKLAAAMRSRLRLANERWQAVKERLAGEDPRTRLLINASRLADLRLRLRETMRARLAAQRVRWVSGARSLQAMSPLAVLERGYAVVTDSAGKLVHGDSPLLAQQMIAVRLHQRTIDAQVTNVREL